MIHYLAIDTNPQNPKLYDSRVGTEIRIQFDGARSFLRDYINKLKLEVVSIYESELPPKEEGGSYRTQIMCWYRMPKRVCTFRGPDGQYQELGEKIQ